MHGFISGFSIGSISVFVSFIFLMFQFSVPSPAS